MTIDGKMLEGTMEGHDRKPRERAELGRRLAASAGYLVLASDGRHIGVVDHIRYEQHADYPDEIVVRRRNALLRRRRAIPFDSVQAVDPRQRTVTLRIDSTAVDRSHPP
jgi:sporulation protein YlmC with PRC-barrel domain